MSTYSSRGVTPLTGDTWPASGVGGVAGTGKGQVFFVGGYASSGCAGAVPLGEHVLKTGTSLNSSAFFEGLSRSLLAAMQPDDKEAAEPSPKSVVGFEFGEGLQEEVELRMDHTAWSEVLCTD